MPGILASLLAVFLGTAPAAEMPRDRWRVVGLSGAEPLNVRAGPSTAYDVVAEIAAGTVVRGFGCEGEGDQRWCRIAAPDAAAPTGWAASRFLEAATP